MAGKKKTCMEHIRSIAKHTTVEASGFSMFFAASFAAIASETLHLEKACRVNLNFTDAVCDAIRNQDPDNSDNEKMVQEYLASQLWWTSALQTILPSILYPFVGGWMDMTGRRKLFMIIPIFGEVLHNISNIVNVIFFSQLPLQVTMFFNVFFTSVTGSSSVFFLAMFCYIVDLTSEKNRTHRLGLVAFFVQVGMVVGSAFSGIILKRYGYYAVFCTAFATNVLNLSYMIFFLSDPPRSLEKTKHDAQGIIYGLKIFFSSEHIKNAIRVIIKKTEDNRRFRLLLLIFVGCTLFGPMYGESAVLYLLVRLKFNWAEVQFSIFQTFTFFTGTVGSILAVIVFAKILKWHDSILGLIACASKITAAFIYCFSNSGSLFYLAPAVDMFSSTAILAIRSIISKQVEPDELGKVNSIVGQLENLMPVAYVSMYTRMYTRTMDVLPGAVFLFGALLTIPAVDVFVWLFVRYRKGLQNIYIEENNPKEVIHQEI